jgi:hypothetical protein
MALITTLYRVPGESPVNITKFAVKLLSVVGTPALNVKEVAPTPPAHANLNPEEVILLNTNPVTAVGACAVVVTARAAEGVEPPRFTALTITE